MNKSYRKGYYYEKKTRQILEKKGYCCIESRGSHGTIDIVALLQKDNTELPLIKAIQVKSGASNYIKDWKKLTLLKLPAIISKEIWIYKSHQKPIIKYIG